MILAVEGVIAGVGEGSGEGEAGSSVGEAGALGHGQGVQAGEGDGLTGAGNGPHAANTAMPAMITPKRRQAAVRPILSLMGRTHYHECETEAQARAKAVREGGTSSGQSTQDLGDRASLAL